MKILINLGIMLSLTGCFFGGKGDLKTALQGTSGEESSELPSVVTEAELISTVGQRDYEQILASIELKTGVTNLNNNNQQDVNRALDGLSSINKASGFNEANFQSILKVSAAYCDQLVNNNNARNALFPNLGNIGGNSLSTQQIDHIVAVIKDRFLLGNSSEAVVDRQTNDIKAMMTAFQGEVNAEAQTFGACAMAITATTMLIK